MYKFAHLGGGEHWKKLEKVYSLYIIFSSQKSRNKIRHHLILLSVTRARNAKEFYLEVNEVVVSHKLERLYKNTKSIVNCRRYQISDDANENFFFCSFNEGFVI